MKRILLSVPHMSGEELGYVREAFDRNWISTVGPDVTAFEREFEEHIGLPAVAVCSGTAAIHLGLRLLGVGRDDEVICPTLTFVATANPIVYLGARPIFLDSDRTTWNLDPQLLSEVLAKKARANRLPKAVVVVHLYGQSADMDPILEICGEYEIPVLEDAAEALGANYKDRLPGTMGQVGAFSFNGNKIITTAGGGMLVSPRRDWVESARKWALQARDPGIAYEHSELGYNYRLSNILAGIGRGQLAVLRDRVSKRRAIAMRYAAAFEDLPGISLMPQADFGLHTNWLSCFLIDQTVFWCSRDELISHLDTAGVESRPVWKPLHLQPLYKDAECWGGRVAEDLFQRGICLPSSSSLTDAEQEYVIQAIKSGASSRTMSTAKSGDAAS